MDQELFSQSLASVKGGFDNEKLATTLAEIVEYTGRQPLPVFQWDDDHLAISVTVPVDLPPLGNDRGIDIQTQEPVLVVFNVKKYPLKSPVVYPDRLNFPAKHLGHMYVSKKGKPGGFCLVRGSLDDWYATIRPKDLLIRLSNWLRDGAAGCLNEDGDQFEPMRPEGYLGTVVYNYDTVLQLVDKRDALFEGGNFGMLLFERFSRDGDTIIKLLKTVTRTNLGEVIAEFQKEKDKSEDDKSRRNLHFGYVVWSNDNTVFDEYIPMMVDNWKEYRDFAKEFGIDIKGLEHQIINNDLNIYKLVPVFLAVRRPKPIIGFSGNIEIVNYYTLMHGENDAEDGKINDNKQVLFFRHLQPLTVRKAREISGETFDLGKYMLLAGCGALGSKIAMHFGRAGLNNVMYMDPDTLSPHNLVRHAAFANGEGFNKAVYLANAITKIFPNDPSAAVLGLPMNGEFMLDSEFHKFFDTVLDFTASTSFFNSIVMLKPEKEIRINRGVISDNGNLGLLYFEGGGRNPRVDDLQAALFHHALTDNEISEWLIRELSGSKSAIDVKVGVGCNSETFRLPDDIVSYHASYMSRILKTNGSGVAPNFGSVYLHTLEHEPHFFSKTKKITVNPFTVMQSINDRTWEIRFAEGIVEEMQVQMNQAYPHETGGLFAGVANFRTKTIHVMGIIDAPPDSTSNRSCFFRGVHGLKGAVDKFTFHTGNQIGYIGEWHTHPDGPDGMSQVDARTVRDFKNDFEELPAPLPVFLTVVSPNGIYPYVY